MTLHAISAGLVWRSFTPTLSAVTTNPTMGTGATNTGRYLVIGGLLAVVLFTIEFGTGMAAGSGDYYVSMPSDCPIAPGTLFRFGHLHFTDEGVTREGGAPVQRDRSSIWMLRDGAGAFISHAVPWAWSAGDELHGMLMYEIA